MSQNQNLMSGDGAPNEIQILPNSESTSIIGVVSSTTQSSNPPGNMTATSQTQKLITDQILITTNQSNINNTDDDHYYYHHDYLYEDYHHEMSNISGSNTSTNPFNSMTKSTTSNNGNIFGN